MPLPKSYGIARGWHAAGGQVALADLTPGATALCGVGLQWPKVSSATTSGSNLFVRAKSPFFAPPWRGYDWEFFLPNLWIVASGAETFNSNDLGVSYQTLFRGASPFPILWPGTGALGGTIKAGHHGVWCPVDPSVEFESEPNELLHWWGEIFTPTTGQRYPSGHAFGLKGQGASALASNDLGGGRESGSASDPSKRLTGVLSNAAATNAESYGPAMARCKGWDGKTRIVIGRGGDSRDYPTDDRLYEAATRRMTGIAGRGFDDATNGRVLYFYMSGPGSTCDNIGKEVGVSGRWKALFENAPNRLYHDEQGSSGGNDIYGGGATVEEMKARLLRQWAGAHARIPNGVVYHVIGVPWVTDSGTTGFATTAGMNLPEQYPVQLELEDYLRTAYAADALPSYVRILDMKPALQDPANPGKPPVPGVTNGTLSTTTTSSRTATVSIPGRAPVAGEFLVLSYGLSTMENNTIIEVQPQGGDVYICIVEAGWTKAHNAGDAVALAWVHSAAHTGAILNKACIPSFAAYKADGTILTEA